MEKINTPLGECIEEFQRIKSEAKTLSDRLYLDAVISVLQTRMPAERDAMIDFAQNYKSHCFQNDEFPDSARTYFTQTFKSYE